MDIDSDIFRYVIAPLIELPELSRMAREDPIFDRVLREQLESRFDESLREARRYPELYLDLYRFGMIDRERLDNILDNAINRRQLEILATLIPNVYRERAEDISERIDLIDLSQLNRMNSFFSPLLERQLIERREEATGSLWRYPQLVVDMYRYNIITREDIDILIRDSLVCHRAGVLIVLVQASIIDYDDINLVARALVGEGRSLDELLSITELLSSDPELYSFYDRLALPLYNSTDLFDDILSTAELLLAHRRPIPEYMITRLVDEFSSSLLYSTGRAFEYISQEEHNPLVRAIETLEIDNPQSALAREAAEALRGSYILSARWKRLRAVLTQR
jgi:hypothetical protein